METKSIKVYIQDKNYALNVETEAVEMMLKAAEIVNTQVKTFSAHYAVNDSRDLLAMSALQLAFQLLEKESSENKSREALDQSLKDMEKAIGIALL